MKTMYNRLIGVAQNIFFVVSNSLCKHCHFKLEEQVPFTEKSYLELQELLSLSYFFFSNHRLKYFLVDYIFANPSSPHDTTCLFFSSKVRLGLKNYDTLQKCYKITRWFCLCFVKSRLRKHCQGNDLCFGCYVFSSILPRF